MIMKNVSSRNFGGFTLIELLVVVLIIGILSAVALPKYTQLLWKAKASNMQTIMSAIGRSHQRYYDDNYECAPSFDSLDLGISDLSLSPSKTTFVLSGAYDYTKDGKGNADYEILIVAGRGCYTVGRFKKGPWKGAGFIFEL